MDKISKYIELLTDEYIKFMTDLETNSMVMVFGICAPHLSDSEMIVCLRSEERQKNLKEGSQYKLYKKEERNLFVQIFNSSLKKKAIS